MNIFFNSFFSYFHLQSGFNIYAHLNYTSWFSKPAAKSFSLSFALAIISLTYLSFLTTATTIATHQCHSIQEEIVLKSTHNKGNINAEAGKSEWHAIFSTISFFLETKTTTIIRDLFWQMLYAFTSTFGRSARQSKQNKSRL